MLSVYMHFTLDFLKTLVKISQTPVTVCQMSAGGAHSSIEHVVL